MTTTICLPLPPRALSSNGNVYWRTSSAPKRAYRELAAQAAAGITIDPTALIHMRLTFCIKGARSTLCTHPRRKPRAGKALRSCVLCPYCPQDESNALAAFKSGQDGICDALGIKDSRKHLTIAGITIDSTEGPYVRVELS